MAEKPSKRAQKSGADGSWWGHGDGQGVGASSQVENQQNLVTTWVNKGGGEEIEDMRKVTILTFMGRVVGHN